MGIAIDDFPNVSGKKPSFRRIDAMIDFKDSKDNNGKLGDTDLKDHFYVRWTGVLRVPADGEYALFTESDDGSRLWVDGKLVVDNGGVHGIERAGAPIPLKAGDHDLKMDFFQGPDGSMSRLPWVTPDHARIPLPTDPLRHKKDDALGK